MRTAVKKVLKALAAGDKSAAETSFREAVPEIDRMVSKGIIRKNRAANYKSRLNARLKSIG
jgi:small subunit ribosomal protein S20